jgi:hypothetical protein
MTSTAVSLSPRSPRGHLGRIRSGHTQGMQPPCRGSSGVKWPASFGACRGGNRPRPKPPRRSPHCSGIFRIIRSGWTIGWRARAVIPWGAGGSNRPLSSSVMGASNAQGPGGRWNTPTRCSPDAVRNTMAPLTDSLIANGNEAESHRGQNFLKNEECTPCQPTTVESSRGLLLRIT